MTEKLTAKESKTKEITIFNAVSMVEREKAVKALVSGRTPIEEVKEREARGGGTVKYVNTYYMTRQINLLTGWRWKSECLEERFFPTENPREVGARMKVTIWDAEGREYSHSSWGQKDISKWNKDYPDRGVKKGDPIAIFDDIKAAYSDGIKKCLSYFGIASDIYGGKELEFFAEDSNDNDDSKIDYTSSQAQTEFGKYVNKTGKRWSEVFKVLGVKDLSEITDYKDAYSKIKEWIEGGAK